MLFESQEDRRCWISVLQRHFLLLLTITIENQCVPYINGRFNTGPSTFVLLHWESGQKAKSDMFSRNFHRTNKKTLSQVVVN